MYSFVFVGLSILFSSVIIGFCILFSRTLSKKNQKEIVEFEYKKKKELELFKNELKNLEEVLEELTPVINKYLILNSNLKSYCFDNTDTAARNIITLINDEMFGYFSIKKGENVTFFICEKHPENTFFIVKNNLKNNEYNIYLDQLIEFLNGFRQTSLENYKECQTYNEGIKKLSGSKTLSSEIRRNKKGGKKTIMNH